MAQVRLHRHAWSTTLDHPTFWFGLANKRGNGYGVQDIHVKSIIAALYRAPVLKRIAVKVVAHEVQHAAGNEYERTHHDQSEFEEKGLGTRHECGMSTTVKIDEGKHKGRISIKALWSIEHLSPWSIAAAHDLLKTGYGSVNADPTSPIGRHLAKH